MSWWWVVVAVVPGAAYTWSFERQAGAFGLTAVDRTMRFVVASLGFHLLLGWPEYVAWRSVADGSLSVGSFGIAWAAVVLLVAVPSAVGWALGALWSSQHDPDRHRRLRQALRLAGRPDREAAALRLLLGRTPEPRAWDYVFARSEPRLLRAQFRDTGRWVGGRFGSRSYAAGYPETPQDLFIEQAFLVDDDGNFVRDGDGFIETDSGILLRWDDIRVIEVLPTEVEHA